MLHTVNRKSEGAVSCFIMCRHWAKHQVYITLLREGSWGLLFFPGSEDGTQGLVHGKQAFNTELHSSPSPSFQCLHFLPNINNSYDLKKLSTFAGYGRALRRIASSRPVCVTLWDYVSKKQTRKMNKDWWWKWETSIYFYLMNWHLYMKITYLNMV